MSQPIIAVTGTKGKTTVVRLVDFVLQQLGEQVVRVDTSGAYVNSERIYSDEDSRAIWGYASANLPGRFIALHAKKQGPSVLECTLFCATTGLGYKRHDVGVFTNVYEDHLGAFPDIKTMDDIARMKRFVFTKIRSNGTAVFNADDKKVVSQIQCIPKDATKIAVTLQPNSPLPNCDYVCTVQDETIVIVDAHGEKVAAKPVNDLPWLKPGYVPLQYNALLAFATLFSTVEKNQFHRALEALERFEFTPEGGRLAELKAKSGAKIIMDFAHEKISLKEIARYARTMCAKDGRVVGVIRLAPSRSEALVEETAQYIYGFYDSFVVYDKIDGFYRQPQKVKGYKNRQEETGQMATMLAGFLKKQGSKMVETEVREDHAIEAAIKNTHKGDVIVYIVGDDAERSLGFLEEYVV